jgi:hypothetical protein
MRRTGATVDYWLCDSDSGELLLFVDRVGADRWYLQGWYD